MGLLSVELLAMKLKNQTPPKLVVVPDEGLGRVEHRGYVDPLKRTVKLGTIPPIWIIKKG